MRRGLGLVGGPKLPPFDLTRLGGCVLWLRADAGVTLVSGNVSLWKDQSGKGNDATQITPANRPGFTSSGIGGRSSLSNDTSARWMNAPDLSTALAGGGERFFVASDTGNVGVDSNGAIENGIGPVGQGQTLWPFNDGNIYDSFITTVRKGFAYSPVVMASTPHVYDTVSVAGEFTVRIDGTQRFTTASNTVSVTAGAWKLAGDSAVFKGLVAEWIIFNRKLSTTERISVQRYLGNKYGIAVA